MGVVVLAQADHDKLKPFENGVQQGLQTLGDDPFVIDGAAVGFPDIADLVTRRCFVARSIEQEFLYPPIEQEVGPKRRVLGVLRDSRASEEMPVFRHHRAVIHFQQIVEQRAVGQRRRQLEFRERVRVLALEIVEQ